MSYIKMNFLKNIKRFVKWFFALCCKDVRVRKQVFVESVYFILKCLPTQAFHECVTIYRINIVKKKRIDLFRYFNLKLNIKILFLMFFYFYFKNLELYVFIFYKFFLDPLSEDIRSLLKPTLYNPSVDWKSQQKIL